MEKKFNIKNIKNVGNLKFLSQKLPINKSELLNLKKQEEEIRAKAIDVIEFLNLKHLTQELAGNLSGGQKKLLELGRTMMVDSKLVLLDEVGAGVNRTLLNEIIDAINSIRISDHPYHYFYVKPFLPKDLYDKLNMHWLDEKCFWGQNEISFTPSNHKEANLRKVVIIDDTPELSTTVEAQIFWSQFRDMIRQPI